MRKADAQLGFPQVLYKDTKTNIEALTGVTEGMAAYATDTKKFGMYNGTAWIWYHDLWTEVVKASNQDVTFSAALTDDTALQFAVTAQAYHIELYILYAGDSAAGDYKCDFVPSTGNMSGWYSYIGDNTTADAINVSTGIRLAAASSITAIASGTDASMTTRMLRIEAMLRFSATATFKYRFAQNSATSSTSARTKAGSFIRYRALG